MRYLDPFRGHHSCLCPVISLVDYDKNALAPVKRAEIHAFPELHTEIAWIVDSDHTPDVPQRFFGIEKKKIGRVHNPEFLAECAVLDADVGLQVFCNLVRSDSDGFCQGGDAVDRTSVVTVFHPVEKTFPDDFLNVKWNAVGQSRTFLE